MGNNNFEGNNDRIQFINDIQARHSSNVMGPIQKPITLPPAGGLIISDGLIGPRGSGGSGLKRVSDSPQISMYSEAGVATTEYCAPTIPKANHYVPDLSLPQAQKEVMSKACRWSARADGNAGGVGAGLLSQRPAYEFTRMTEIYEMSQRSKKLLLLGD